MTIRLAISVTSTLALAVALISCGNKQAINETPVANATTGTSVDATTAGSISGTIKLNGAPPTMKVINMAAEPACAKEHTTEPAKTEEVVPGENGTLQNVVVYLRGDFSRYSFTVPISPATVDQKGCQYHPHVLALMTGQPLQVINSDPVTHNIHPVPKDNREWNQSQPPGSAPIDQTFARPEAAIPVKCNIHPWMKAYIAVFANPYFQVTGKDGSFDIKNVPPGTYIVTAWHERYGTSEQSVTIGPKESKNVTLAFKAAAAAS
jgi:plastocyanin